MYLEIVKTFPLYGKSIFWVKPDAHWRFSEMIALAVYESGVDFVHPQTKDCIMTFKYKQIKSYDRVYDSIKDTIVLEVSQDEDLDSIEIYAFVTNQAEEIVSILREYSPHQRIVFYTESNSNEENLNAEIEKIRASLLTSNIVQIPGPESSSQKELKSNRKSFFNNEFRRSNSSQNIENLPNETKASKLFPKSYSSNSIGVRKSQVHSYDYLDESKDTSAAYSIADWGFSKTMITTSLSVLPDRESEKWSVETYYMLLNMQLQNQGQLYHIQNIIAKCIEHPRYINELILQLIKQTTNPSELNSYVNYIYYFGI
ncbi:cytochrome c oxidase subunit 1 [Nowakowskiella sp. JEL0078]|nr:cytochrome c oxidase subunit 1 [Nowakowskiella sp. JEL0078]